MKKVLFAVVVVLMLAGVVGAAQKCNENGCEPFINSASTQVALEQIKPQKYNVTITIEYKDIDLKVLADKEAAIKKVIGDAYKIDIQFQKDCPSKSTYYYNGTPSLTLPDTKAHFN